MKNSARKTQTASLFPGNTNKRNEIDALDPLMVRTIRLNQVAAKPVDAFYDDEAISFHSLAEYSKASMNAVVSKLTIEQHGISYLFSKDYFVALLLLTVIQAGGFIYYHVISPDLSVTAEVAASQLEEMVSQSSPEVSVLNDIVNLHGRFSNPISIEFSAIRRKLPALVQGTQVKAPTENENPDEAIDDMAFTKNNGGLVWQSPLSRRL